MLSQDRTFGDTIIGRPHEKCIARSAQRSAIIGLLCLVTLSTSPLAWSETPVDVDVGERGQETLTPKATQAQLSEGWSLSGITGLSTCVPSGEADCESTYPGVSLGVSTEYRWRYVGITIDADWSTLTPTGTGSDSVTHRVSHIGLGLRGYLPLRTDVSLYSGFSLGPGWVDVHDDASESSISWSTFWSDLRVDVGGLMAIDDSWSLEGALSLLLHYGGNRCVLFQGAGPCAAVSDLPSVQQSNAHVLMLRGGVRWTP